MALGPPGAQIRQIRNSFSTSPELDQLDHEDKKSRLTLTRSTVSVQKSGTSCFGKLLLTKIKTKIFNSPDASSPPETEEEP